MATPAFEDSETTNARFVERHRHLGARAQVVSIDDGSVRDSLRA